MAIAASRKGNTPPRVTSTRPRVSCHPRGPEIGQQGQIHYLELDQFIGRRALVTVHSPLNPVVWLARRYRRPDR
jgi:magnesium transporter